ncbi:MAG: hypothetical protein LBG84_08070 [Treponema sp.]|jgi:hypothetical protein|nr:hypothetical protein [Treponema sp.]
MAQNHDYIPYRDPDLLAFAKNLYAYALANAARWSAPSPQAALEALIAAFETALTAYQSPNHGKIDTFNKNEAKKALVSGLRTYIQGFIMRNPNVTNGDKENMNLPIRDSEPSPHPVPDITPLTEAAPSGSRKHTVTAINPATGTKQKPPLVRGVAFARRVRDADAPPSRADDMPSDFQSGAARDFQYTEADLGRVVDYATAYENEGAQRGPWSNVVSVIIA